MNRRLPIAAASAYTNCWRWMRSWIDCLRRNDQGGFAKAARNQPGYRPLVQHALELARAGVTTVDEAMGLAGWME